MTRLEQNLWDKYLARAFDADRNGSTELRAAITAASGIL